MSYNQNPTKQDYEEAIEAVRQAQELLSQAYDLMEDAVRKTNDRNAEAYLLDHLKIMMTEDHGFLSRDLNCDTWVERMEEAISELEE